MADAAAWPSIRAHGLQSAAALVARYGASPRLVTARRPDAVTLDAPGLPPVVLRDNGSLHDERLRGCLEGMDLAAFYRMLNGRVYFWPTAAKVAELRRARRYRDRCQLILEVDTAGLLARHGDRVRLSPINMGSTLFSAVPRGPHTARPLSEHPIRRLAEVSVEGAVPDVAALVRAAGLHHPDGRVEALTVEGHPPERSGP